MKRLLPLFLLLGGCSSLGITNGAKQATTYEQQHPIAVKAQALPATLLTQRTSDGRTRVSGDDENLYKVIEAYNAAGGGTVHVSAYGHGAGVRKDVAAVLKRLAAAGIPEDTARVEYLNDDGVHFPGQVTVSFEKSVAQAPDCRGAWVDNSADAYRNTRRKSFGCWAQSNLATTLANPNDLHEMRPLGQASAQKRGGVYSGFVGSGSGGGMSAGPGGSSAGASAPPAMPM